jgi:glucosylglycerol-phosphate synthase
MLILATDLDGTLLGGSLADRDRLYQRLRSAGDQVVLIYVTGRALSNVTPLLADPAMPRPDYIIADVGATVVDGATLAPVEPLDGELARRWIGEPAVVAAIGERAGLERQQQAQVRRCSYYTDDPATVAQVRSAVAPLGCEVVYSAGRYLDVLPAGITKGATLAQLIAQLGLDPKDVLVAGDTLNDLSMFGDSGFRGVVVADGELRARTRDRVHTHHAQRAGAGGILEAIEQFGLLPDPASAGPPGTAELVIAYHRQPFDEAIEHGAVVRRPPASPNGIIPTLLGLFRGGRRGAWVAWTRCADPAAGPASGSAARDDRVQMPDGELPNLTISRLALSEDDVALFYDRFCKEALWPILHGFIERAAFDHRHWQHYLSINQRFAHQVAREAAPGALVWIHDYNLWLVPDTLRRLRPDVRIALFHHTPFPAADAFRVLPWSGEILASLLQCDYLGFHIPRYVENFVDAARSQFALEVEARQACDPRFCRPGSALHVDDCAVKLRHGDRSIRLGAHPVGLDLQRITDCLAAPAVRTAVRRLGKQLSDRRVVVCAERLDYMKGSLHKLVAFERFLAVYPEWREQLTLISICTPPASGMTIYSGVRDQIEQAVGKINGRFATATWTPITYMFRQVAFPELVTYLANADVAWITPLRDGLNLVAKEYVAVRSQLGEAGVLIVSEFAGASIELAGALVTNPYDAAEMADTLQRALQMDPAEQAARMHGLADIVRRHDVAAWATGFVDAAQPPPALRHARPRAVRG